MSIKTFESLLLNDFVFEYELFLKDSLIMDKSAFYSKFNEIIKKWFLIEYYLEEGFEKNDLFVLFLLKNELIYRIDSYCWVYEDKDKKQIIKNINQMLLKCGVKNYKLKNSIFEGIIQENIKKDEYLSLLFKKINQELNSIQYKLKCIDIRKDWFYYYFIVSNENYDKLENKDILYDLKYFEMYLLTKTINTKLMVYLKNKFGLKVTEVKDFIKQEKIMLFTGRNKELFWKEKEKVTELGGEIEIKETIY
jgi:hypothetical protein